MSKTINFFIIFTFSFFNFMQASDTSWMKLVRFAGVCSLHDRLLRIVDQTPNKTVGAKIRDGLTVGSAAYLITSPCLFPNEPEKTKMYRSLAGITLMFGHLVYRWHYKSESRVPSPVVTVGADNLMVGPGALQQLIGGSNFGSGTAHQTLEDMQKESNRIP